MKKTKAEGERLQEAQSINSSLLELGYICVENAVFSANLNFLNMIQLNCPGPVMGLIKRIGSLSLGLKTNVLGTVGLPLNSAYLA